MSQLFRIRVSDPSSDNLKSAIQKPPRGPKLVGLLVIAFVLVVAVAVVEAQPKKVFRIGYLVTGNPTSESARSDTIRQRLRELGYIEGQNIVSEYRYAEGKYDRIPELAAELVRLKVDVILVSGGQTQTRAVMKETKTIPIVMVGLGSDPVEAGLIESLARPGGNVTGITNLTPELGGKRLEILKEAVGKLTRVAVLYDPANPPNVLQVKEYLPPAVRALKLTIRSWEVRDEDGFDKVFAALNRERPDGLYVTGGSLMLRNVKRIAGLAIKSRSLSMGFNTQFVEAGGLMSYGRTKRTATGRSPGTWTGF